MGPIRFFSQNHPKIWTLGMAKQRPFGDAQCALFNSLSLTFSVSLSFFLSLSLSNTHTHTHTLSLSLSFSLHASFPRPPTPLPPLSPSSSLSPSLSVSLPLSLTWCLSQWPRSESSASHYETCNVTPDITRLERLTLFELNE